MASQHTGRKLPPAATRDDQPAPPTPAVQGPPTDLTRQVDEAALREVEHRIFLWMMRYVVEHCREPRDQCPLPGGGPRSPAIELYVNRYFRELWDMLPERLKREHAEVQARLNAGPDPA